MLGTSGTNGVAYAEFSPALIPNIGIETGHRAIDDTAGDTLSYQHSALYFGFNYPIDDTDLFDDDGVFVSMNLGPIIGGDARGAVFDLAVSYVQILDGTMGPAIELKAGYRLEHLTGFKDASMADPKSTNHHMLYIGVGFGFRLMFITV
ncbi:MAG: hypothetical protein LBV04_04650 [Deferribacteraceae bacterium]|nr:hypothetical protein [Deferribacteraceae bacterium]